MSNDEMMEAIEWVQENYGGDVEMFIDPIAIKEVLQSRGPVSAMGEDRIEAALRNHGKLLERWLYVARSGHFRDTTHLSIQAHPVFDDTLAALNQQEQSNG